MSLPWFEQLSEVLAETPVCGYAPDVPAATEPTALAALALAAYGRIEAAGRATDWLRQIQHRSGTVGICSRHDRPIWPTSLAVLAWTAVDEMTTDRCYSKAIERAVAALLAQRGATSPRHELMGHDTTLAGWPWADGTHSWLEPSALAVLALKSAGRAQHPRTREAVRLLLDRQLPSGGCNYGNTSVLGQLLLPHVQPTGLALLALAGETADARITKSLKFLEREGARSSGTASLCYAALALATHGVDVPELPRRLEAAYQRCVRSQASPHKLALLALAAAADRRPLHPSVFREFAV